MFEEESNKQTNKQTIDYSSRTKVRKQKSNAHKKHTSLQYCLIGSENLFDEAVDFLVTDELSYARIITSNFDYVNVRGIDIVNCKTKMDEYSRKAILFYGSYYV